MDKKQIRFQWESEKKVRISQAGIGDSLFYEGYRQAMAGVAEIVRASMMYTRGEDRFFIRKKNGWEQGNQFPARRTENWGNDSESAKKGRADWEDEEDRPCSGSDYDPGNDDLYYNYTSNLIVFSGERGAGKSSAMLTFVDNLKTPGSRLFEDGFLREMVERELPGVDYEPIANMLRNCSFVQLPPIDPTTLEDNTDILTTILARMFQLADKKWKEQVRNASGCERPQGRSEKRTVNEKNKLMEAFAKCYNQIRAIKGTLDKPLEYDGLELLSELGSSAELKRALARLVEQLLAFCEPEQRRDMYLVLQIDDTDMNILQAYQILEDIRKYLVIPRVIIVMAANLEHLLKVVESNFLAQYDKDVAERERYVHDITRQYITKLIPQTRQINLPPLGAYLREHMDNVGIRYSTPDRLILPDRSEYEDSQEQIFRLIYRKTGIVFVRKEGHLHRIIPDNMRLLAHFLGMLVQMKDVADPDRSESQFFVPSSADQEKRSIHRRTLENRLQNVNRFRDYFLTTWCESNLSAKDARFLNGLESIDISERVRSVCKYLWNKGIKREFIPEGAALTGSSYADMVRICRRYDEIAVSEQDENLAFAIHTYFSLLSHCIVLEDLVLYYNKENTEEEAPSEAPDQTLEEGESVGAKTPNRELGCGFFRLYTIYGSRLFSYFHEFTDSEEQEATGRWSQNVGDTRLDAAHQSGPNDQESSANRIFRIEMRWKNRMPDWSQEKLPFVKQSMAYLYSMLADYQQSGSSDELWLDICTPILNCLYLGDGNEATPFVQSRRVYSFKYSDTNIRRILEKDWLTMRESALLTVLNWDVQDRIGQEVLKKRSSSKKYSKIKTENWAVFLNSFYWQIISPFYNILDDDADIPVRYIGCLKGIRFTVWLDSLPPKRDQESAGVSQEAWLDIIRQLHTSLDKIESSETKSTNGAKTAKAKNASAKKRK